MSEIPKRVDKNPSWDIFENKKINIKKSNAMSLSLTSKSLVSLSAALLLFFLRPYYAPYLWCPLITAQSYLIDPIKRCMGDYQTFQEQQDTYTDFLSRYIQLQATADFERDTREIVAFQSRYDAPGMVAQVLERHCAGEQQYFLLDKGSRNGIVPDAVVVHKDMLVGKITHVYPHYSRCMLITDRDCKVSAYVAGTDIAGIVRGTGDGLLELLHVSHLQHPNAGALVISSGYGLLFPRGFGLGVIHSIEPQQLLLKIVCKPLLDFSQITYCVIRL